MLKPGGDTFAGRFFVFGGYMPYKIFEENGEFCVYKHAPDGSKTGKNLGCHPTRDEANDQMAAIYANENKGVVRKAVDAIRSILAITGNDDIQPEIIEPVNAPLPSLSVLTKENPMAFWKGKDDQWLWLARYSDSFRDDDWPVKEIVSSASHKFSIEMVDKGVYPMPELWLWHEPAWKWGQATVVAYDEVSPGVGFAMAGGTVDKGKEWIAESINKSGGVLVSHGMPKIYVEREPDDPTIIAKHMTYEVSPLPIKRAAVQRTGFVVFQQKGVSDMAVTDEKRTEMAQALGVTPDQLKGLEDQNKQIAEQAAAAGTQNKAKSEPPAAPKKDGEEGEDENGDKKKEKTPQYVTAQDLSAMTAEIVKGIGESVGTLVKQMGTLAERLAAVEQQQVQHQKQRDEATTPAASLYQQIMSAVTKAADESSEEEDKDKKKEKAPVGPVETKSVTPADGNTNSQFLNSLIKTSRSNRVGYFNTARNGGNNG